jgi:hypothetical protein
MCWNTSEEFMRTRYFAPALILVAALLTGATPTSAGAATTPDDKDRVLRAWTQPAAASFAKWRIARTNKDAWADYRFNWATDGCTGGPDRPFGHDFRLPCYRHDFGYRNYGEAGQFRQHKRRLDLAFLADLRRVCDSEPPVRRPGCDALATLYYGAAVRFGHA